jgi:hypothetical protein
VVGLRGRRVGRARAAREDDRAQGCGFRFPRAFAISRLASATERERERFGHFSVSAIPDHIQQDNAKPPFDWLRINVATDNIAVVVIDREQATKLRDMLTAWLTRGLNENGAE